MDVDALKARACAAIDEQAGALVELSQRIHAHPELAFHETQAAAWLAEYLRGRRFDVTVGIAGLPTAFRAVAGTGSPAVAILAEYDALPVAVAPVPVVAGGRLTSLAERGLL